jgi:hypothetical protein
MMSSFPCTLDRIGRTLVPVPCHVTVMYGQKIVAVLLLATECQVGGATVNDRIGAVEATDDKLVMYLMAHSADVA